MHKEDLMDKKWLEGEYSSQQDNNESHYVLCQLCGFNHNGYASLRKRH